MFSEADSSLVVSNLQSRELFEPVSQQTFSMVHAPLRGEVSVPGSKSVSNRALVCAALASPSSTVDGVAEGDDTTRMVGGLMVLGAHLDINGTSVRVSSPIARNAGGVATIDAGLAGTTSRFLTAVAAMCERETVITGAASLQRRPMGELHDLLRAMGARVASERDGCLPVTVSRGALRTAGVHQLEARGDVSSQFISAIMMIAPLCGGVDLRLTGSLVSARYIDMTAGVMRSFGAAVQVEHDARGRTVSIAPGEYRGTHYRVDADWSSASYPFAAIALTGGEVLVPGLRTDSSQPEAAFVGVLEQMGCKVRADAQGVRVSRDSTHALRGVDVDMSEMSDLVPTVAVMGACAEGTTRLRGVGFIRAKESDRLGDLAHELTTCGVDVEVEKDGLTIHGGALRSAVVYPHHDHRLAMSLALLSLRQDGIVVDDADVVTKSWPSYWDAMRTGLLRT